MFLEASTANCVDSDLDCSIWSSLICVNTVCMQHRINLLLKRKNYSLYGPHREKTCLRRFANNKGADQPAHPRSLISAFVIHFLESTMSKLATNENSIF